MPTSFQLRSSWVLLVVGVLVGVTIAGPVSAAPPTKVTWHVSSLAAGETRNLRAVVSTNSPGMKTWSKRGTCTLTPTWKPTRVTMGATGSCVLVLNIAKSKNYSARMSRKTITLVVPATTLLVTTTVAPATTVVLTCATGGTCTVGDTGPGRGKVFYVAPSDFTSTGSACGTACKYLEAAPFGWLEAATRVEQWVCVDRGPDPSCAWSSSTSAASGSTGTKIGAGYANTSVMIAQSNTAGKAATIARAFQGGGKTDWHLPSKDELNVLCKWAFNDTVNAVCNGNGSGGLSLANGGFNSGFYWSSSELEASLAWDQNFSMGRQNYGTKTGSLYVRPVRAF